jgi:DNA-binding beta-propeller fold protein YncE
VSDRTRGSRSPAVRLSRSGKFVYIPADLVYPSNMRALARIVRVTLEAHAGAAIALLALLAPLAGCSGGGGGNPPPPPPDATPVPADLLIAFDRQGELYILDPNTGVDTLKLDTNLGGQNLGVVSSALYVSDAGRIWLGMGGAGNPPCPACVLSLDHTTGAATMLAATDMKGVASMARSPAGGFIYAANGNSSELWGIDPANGAPRRIADFSEGVARGGGMAFDRNGNLYAALDSALYTVNPSTAATAQVQQFTYTGFPAGINDGAINSMALLGNVLYGLVFDRTDSNRPTYLVRIDPATATVTHVNRNSSPMEGLAVVPANLLP